MKNLLEKMQAFDAAFFKFAIKDFNEMAALLAETVKANVFIIRDDGSLAGYCVLSHLHCNPMQELIDDVKKNNKEIKLKVRNIKDPIINKHYEDSKCLISGDNCVYADRIRSVWPIYVNGESKGLFFVGKISEALTEEEIILCEHACSCVSIVAMHQTYIKETEIERKRQQIRMGFDTLSYSEMEAVGHVFTSLEGKEGLLVASKIADKAGITRSVIVNALRKLESAGLIETRSLGMKGTFIRIQNDLIFNELNLDK